MNDPNRFIGSAVDLTAAHPPDQPIAALQQSAPMGRKGVPTKNALPPEEDEDGTTPSSQGPRKKKRKSNRARFSRDERELLGPPPKRPFTAYNAYFTVARKNWLDSHPKCDENPGQKWNHRFLQMSKDIIKDWKDLSEEEKAPYVAKSKAARAQYQIDIKEYKQRCFQLLHKQASDSKCRDTATVTEKQGKDVNKASTPETPRSSSQNKPASTTVAKDRTYASPVTACPLSVPSKVESAEQTLSTPSPLMAPQAPAPLEPSLLNQQQSLLLSQGGLTPVGVLGGGLAGGLVAPQMVSLNPTFLQQQYNFQHQLAIQAQISQNAFQPIVATVDPLTGILTPAVGLTQNHAAATLGIHQPIVVLPSTAATTPFLPQRLSVPLSSALGLQQL